MALKCFPHCGRGHIKIFKPKKNWIQNLLPLWHSDMLKIYNRSKPPQ